MVVNFFSGKKLFPTFKKDLEAVKLLKNMQDPAKPAEPTQPAQTFIQQNFYAAPNGQFPNVPFPQQQIPNNNPFQQIPTNNEQPKMVIENKEESSND